MKHLNAAVILRQFVFGTRGSEGSRRPVHLLAFLTPTPVIWFLGQERMATLRADKPAFQPLYHAPEEIVQNAIGTA